MAEQQPKYRGIPVFIDGRELIVPALSVRQFRDNIALLVEPLGEVTPQNVAARIGKYVPVIGMALRRNYPELTDDELLDVIDLDSFPELVRAVQAASGMKAVRPGEVQPAAAKSTGAGSTAQ